MAGSYGDEWLAELAKSQPELLLQKAASLEWDSVSFPSMVRAFIDRAKALEAPGNGRDLDMALEIKTAVRTLGIYTCIYRGGGGTAPPPPLRPVT